ncbi:pyruvate carboxylase [Friedmanniomyces endolithicus]|uniref:Pyruvate carboxylase n=1 Tax=Friedmanniomyces endolithicus TaxID=329885 RepID=A0AAN6JYW9_9PEZI|nr:pyruvate carboxylase [Friedmanniomyces endolithicus]KAK0953236.1 pyruvate carboxylase [Friedmanniomyces endolithicus]KAK0955546.1 pyruvate carboxylase [Friedmanniomyces endolithicus]KAK1026348.1 pyruvate carboxylase [Friedmanniomyces endolithicus]
MLERYPTPDSTPPTPVRYPSASPAQLSISAEINVATRKQHTELNRLIIKRLSLALPARPWGWRRGRSPALLAQGIAAFAQIYFEFESAWSAIERSPEKDENGDMVHWLANLRPRGLERTQRLRGDLKRLGCSTAPALECREPAQPGRLSGRPHTLIAVELEKGKVLILKLLAVGPLSEQTGQREVFYEMNGEVRQVTVDDSKAAVENKSRPKADVGDSSQVGAPMSGVVVEVRVKEGTEVSKGDPIAVLSAMKMEMVISAPHSGKIGSLGVKEGDSVDGQDLVCKIVK